MTTKKIKITAKDVDDIKSIAKGLVNEVRGEIVPELLLFAALERHIIKKVSSELPFEVEINEIECIYDAYGDE